MTLAADNVAREEFVAEMHRLHGMLKDCYIGLERFRRFHS
jgi:hypothetical protein